MKLAATKEPVPGPGPAVRRLVAESRCSKIKLTRSELEAWPPSAPVSALARGYERARLSALARGYERRRSLETAGRARALRSHAGPPLGHGDCPKPSKNRPPGRTGPRPAGSDDDTSAGTGVKRSRSRREVALPIS